MNKEQLEKMFDKEFYQKWMWSLEIAKLAQQKLFIFNEVIPEVLKNLLPQYKTLNRNIWHDFAIDKIKQKAKENFWIEL